MPGQVYGVWAINGTSGAYKNNKGTILWGAPANTTLWQAPNNGTLVTNLSRGFNNNNAKISPSSAGASGVNQIKSGLTFAKMTTGQYLILGDARQGYIGGVANTALSFPSAENATNVRRIIHRTESKYTRLVVTAGWNYVTGRPLSEPGVTNTSFGNDDSARPTRAIPGEFVWLETGQTPTQKDYSSKTD